MRTNESIDKQRKMAKKAGVKAILEDESALRSFQKKTEKNQIRKSKKRAEKRKILKEHDPLTLAAKVREREYEVEQGKILGLQKLKEDVICMQVKQTIEKNNEMDHLWQFNTVTKTNWESFKANTWLNTKDLSQEQKVTLRR